jgi:hypothetical protein
MNGTVDTQDLCVFTTNVGLPIFTVLCCYELRFHVTVRTHIVAV